MLLNIFIFVNAICSLPILFIMIFLYSFKEMDLCKISVENQSSNEFFLRFEIIYHKLLFKFEKIMF
jgi:hypothetical protein